MLVSAISRKDGATYMPYNGLRADYENYTLNSSRPALKETVPQEDFPKVLDSVNQWKNFCHKQILGEKLNIIA